jgi:predicted RNase H-like HicB family nuclease
LVTEGDTLEAAHENVRDALAAVIELYADQHRPLPQAVVAPRSGEMIWSEALVEST